MQSLYSSFPAGASGAGLLVLRFATLAALLPESSSDPSPLMLIVAILIACSLSIGFLTVIVALLAILMQAPGVFTARPGDLVLVLSSLAQPLALALLGPGAYSLDARLFGRRLIFESRRQERSD